MVPAHSRYVIVGAGIHGLSAAWHLARELRARGLGSGEDILILDKTGVGAGASGIACGVIRNNCKPPMRPQPITWPLVRCLVRPAKTSRTP